MNKTKNMMLICCMALSSCTYLSKTEQYQLHDLQRKGITVDHPKADWERPAKPWVAGLLNFLPGMGNFYLGFGDGADYWQLLFGAVNVVTWPYSVVWGVPSAAFDAETINERDLVRYYDKKENSQPQSSNVSQPVRQNLDYDVYYPGDGYYYNGYYEQNDGDGRNNDGSCSGGCGAFYSDTGRYNNVKNYNYSGYSDSYDYDTDSKKYNGRFYNNSSYNAKPYNGNPYTEEYFDRQEEDSHKYDWERYYY